jgi:ornithine carbamoyltransferase
MRGAGEAFRLDSAPVDPLRLHRLATEAIGKDETGWRGRSLVSLLAVEPEQLRAALVLASRLKSLDLARKPIRAPDTGLWSYPRTLAILFEKPSLRTRVSFEVCMAHLGGHAIYLAPGDVGLGSREPVSDVAEVLSRWVDCITARVFDHATVQELANTASVPVINALSDQEHPLQALADLLTIAERKGRISPELKLAYVGDGNNVLHALMAACALVGMRLSAACPEGYRPNEGYVTATREIAERNGFGELFELAPDPIAAVTDADVVYTDVWTSMGQEAEREERLALFRPYQINSALMAHAKSDAIVMHCLPAHHNEEITDCVFRRHKDVILEQAENRMHTQKALIALMVGP